MSIIGIIFIWIWLAVAYAILTRWPMGKESDRRRKFWARFEDK